MNTNAIEVKNPYPGLRPFETEDAEYFFGRDQQVDELLPRLRDHRFVAVLGLSGSGKSSLVKAGLIPALKAGHLIASGSRWRIAVMRPGSHPIVALAAALDQALIAAPDRVANLWRSTNALLHDSRTGRTPDESLLVVVDQFEELFRVKDARAAAHFVDLLLAVEQDVSPNFRTYVVLTMRTDRLGECSRFDGLPEALNQSQYLVPKLGSDQLREAIEGPAALTDTEIEPGLVQQLVVEASQGSDRLPLLQHLLAILWEGRQTGPDGSRLVSLSQYREAGSAAKALNDHADRVLESLTPDQRRTASLVFRALTGAGAGRDLRRPLRLSQLADETGTSLEEVRQVVEHFRTANFLTSPDREFTDDWEADIMHESLVRQWKKLSTWAAEEAADAEDYRFYSLNEARHAGLLTERSLDSAIRWLTQRHNAAWAARYGGDFEATVQYIQRSEFERLWYRYWAPSTVMFSFILALSFFKQIRQGIRPILTSLVPPSLTTRGDESWLLIAVTMFISTALTAYSYLLLERHGKPAIYRSWCKVKSKRIQETAEEPRIELPPIPESYAGFGRRVLSMFVDGLVWCFILLAVFIIDVSSSPRDAPLPDYFFPLLFLVHYLYHVLTITSKRQATFGMRLAKVYVSDVYGNPLSWTRASKRHFAKLLTFYTVVGSFMPLWNNRRQTLHDFLAGTVVRCSEPATGDELKLPAGRNPK